MSTTLRARSLARLAAAALLASSVLLPSSADTARAADVAFGEPRATATYADGIDFTVPLTASVPLSRVEIRLRFPGSLGPFVEEVPVPPAGTRTLSYRLDTSGGGHIYPNTPIEATWAAIPQGGGNPVVSTSETIRYQDTSQDWRTLRGDVMVVHWYEGSEAFGRKALQIGEEAVKRTAATLGVSETEPIDFFIYGERPAFRDALGPGAREWSVGTSIAEIRTLFGLITPDQIDSSEVERVISHELVHLVFDTAVRNPYRDAPHWFNEGLATYLSEGYAPDYRQPVEEAAAAGELLPLSALTGSFPTGSDSGWLAYSESVSAIDFIMRKDGQQGLLAIVSGFKEGLTDDEAFTKALGKDFATFERDWLNDVDGASLERLGPVPNPTGPLPPGWEAPAGGGGPAATQPPGAPAPSAATQPGDTPESAAGGSAVPLLLAIGGVILVVVVALVLARRRAPAP